MTQKLLLAEGLDLLRQCEIQEYDIHKAKQRIDSGGSRMRQELLRLVKNYESVYQQYIYGLEILNYVRHSALDDTNPRNAAYNKNLADFCCGKMSAYMDRCDHLIRQLDAILLPVDLVDQVKKEGYVPEETIFIQDGINYPLTHKEKTITKEFTIFDGTYIVTLKNRDDYTLAAPDVTAVLTVTPQCGSGLEPVRTNCNLRCQTAWRKVIGVVGASSLQLEVKAQGMRDSHVSILIQKWKPVNSQGGVAPLDGPGSCPFTSDNLKKLSPTFDSASKNTSTGETDYGPSLRQTPTQPQTNALSTVQQPPTIPDFELAALANYNINRDLPGVGGLVHSTSANPMSALESMHVPHVDTQSRQCDVLRVPGPLEVNPAGLDCAERMQRVRDVMNTWPKDGVMMTSLPLEQQHVVQGVYALPLPRTLPNERSEGSTTDSSRSAG